LPEKAPEKKTSKKRRLYFIGCIFTNKGTSSIIFAQISPKIAQTSPNLPKRTILKHDLKKSLHVCKTKTQVYTHFAQISFTHIFPQNHRFCPDFKGFCLDFHQIKTFGGAVAPAPPPVIGYTTGL